jgi:hypothetical protein
MAHVSLIIHYQLMKKKKHHIFLVRLQLTDFDREEKQLFIVLCLRTTMQTKPFKSILKLYRTFVELNVKWEDFDSLLSQIGRPNVRKFCDLKF